MNRGEVLIVDFPYTDGSASKIRPALVVQNDSDNTCLKDTIVAMITGNISRVDEVTQHLVDPQTVEGATSGLHGPSAVLCRHLYTIRQFLVLSTIDHHPAPVMDEIDKCLKAALDLS